MPTLTAPPPPRPTIESRSPFSSVTASAEHLPVRFVGRTLAEYVQCFALELSALKGRDVLDVAAGPSSFVAEACARGIDAVAVDPLYGATTEALATRVQLDQAQLVTPKRGTPELFRLKSLSSMDAAEADGRLAGQRFLADYATHFVHGRYVGGSLPRLPFFDNAFDVVLCAHLLFFQAGRFDFEWHTVACRELVRVTAGEVRIQPVCGADGRPHPKLTALRRELAAGGIESEVVRVSYEFAGGSQSMLVLRKEGS